MLSRKINLSNLTPKKLVFGISAIVILYIAFWFLFSYSWLTVSAGSKDAVQIKISDSKGVENKSFELTEKSKIVLLKRSSYRINASKGDQFSSHKKSLGFLWFNKINIRLEPQKSSKFLGVNQLPCAKEKGQETLFSSCSPQDTGNVLVSSTRGPLTQKSPMESDHDSTTAGVLKSYKDGYLNAKVVENKLIISARETNNNESLVINDFKGDLNTDRFSVSPGSDNFAVYNISSNEILSFKNISDNSPVKISLPKNIEKPGFVNKVIISNNYIYLLNARDYKVEDHSHVGSEEKEPEKPEDISKNTKQKIFIYSNETGGQKAEHEFPGDWQIQNAVAGFNNKVLISASILKKSVYGELYIINDTSKPLFVETVGAAIQDVCWKDKDNFYYLADAGRSIYRYSLSDQVSFLDYGGLVEGKFVKNISCDSGELYFNFDFTSENRRVADKYFGFHHYKLADSEFTGIRLESLIPLFVVVGGAGGDVVEVNSTSHNGLSVEMSMRGGKNLSKEDARKAIIGKLQEEGVNTESLVFDFKY